MGGVVRWCAGLGSAWQRWHKRLVETGTLTSNARGARPWFHMDPHPVGTVMGGDEGYVHAFWPAILLWLDIMKSLRQTRGDKHLLVKSGWLHLIPLGTWKLLKEKAGDNSKDIIFGLFLLPSFMRQGVWERKRKMEAAMCPVFDTKYPHLINLESCWGSEKHYQPFQHCVVSTHHENGLGPDDEVHFIPETRGYSTEITSLRRSWKCWKVHFPWTWNEISRG